MPIQIPNAGDKPLNIATKHGQFLADRASLLPHPHVFQDCAHRIQCCHAGRRRYDPDACGKSFAHDLGQATVQFGIDGFGWQKHQRAVGCFALDQIAFRNLLDVHFDRLPKHGQSAFAFGFCVSSHQLFISFEREFRVNDDRAGRIW